MKLYGFNITFFDSMFIKTKILFLVTFIDNIPQSIKKYLKIWIYKQKFYSCNYRVTTVKQTHFIQ